MMNKKLTALIASTALVAVIGAGATMAYFTDADNQTNIVDMGNVQIDLNEYKDEGKEPFENLVAVVPGAHVDKMPVITNIGKNTCYVRALVKINNPENVLKAEKAEKLDIEDLGIDENDWYIGGVNEDGYTEIYYQHVLTAVDEAVLFTGFDIPNWNNIAADGQLSIDIKAEAIQNEHFNPQRDPDTDQITGWNDEVIEDYVQPV